MLDEQRQYTQQQLQKKDQDIAELTASLNKLAITKIQELERLPTLFNTLKNSMEKYTKEWIIWRNHRRAYVETQQCIAEQLSTLAKTQMQLIGQLKTYQSTITPPDYLKRDTTKLESDSMKLEEELNALASAQSKIEQSQTKITESQTAIQTELKELSTLLRKSEK